MLYARINLENTNYTILNNNWQFLRTPNVNQLNQIYHNYCRYKKFSSVMPIFDSEYTDSKNDIIGYFNNSELTAFSIIKRHDATNAEAVQFAWTYSEPKLQLGIKSLKHECAMYKSLGYKFLYLGEANEYKKKIAGFEILGEV
jgi:hypothetical protein